MKILIIDDEPAIRQSLRTALGRRDWEIVTAASIGEGEQFASADFDCILLDIYLPDGSGLDLLHRLKASQPHTPVVMISGNADIDDAVRAVKEGAFDFLQKPLVLERVIVTIENATRSRRLTSENARLVDRVFGQLIGVSPVIEEIRRLIARAAPRTDRFLITGENGTGKELVAHLIHSQSRFADGPFVPVNCAALPKELIESELFGHTAGAFTGARKARSGYFKAADGGSIFLDEIAELTPTAQAKLLRVLETREVTPVGSEKPTTVTGTIIAATNRDLESEIRSGRFREDLFYRLNVVAVALPPLRERGDDIPILADYFLSRLAAESGEAVRRLEPSSLELLRKQTWRGNVRELRNLMERVHIYATGEDVTPELLLTLLPRIPDSTSESLRNATARFERDYIETAIARHDGNIAAAARELGLERSHLYKKLKRLEGAKENADPQS